MSTRWRVGAFCAVAACFFVQGALVWGDIGARPGSTAVISPLARRGQQIFRSRGCQSCHPLFGMGGFLGPDVTNAARRVPPGRFAEVLDKGTPAMPAYHLNASEQRALLAYLEAVSATGQGTPPPPPGETGTLFAAGLERWATRGGVLPSQVARGAALVAERGCGACHLSFAAMGVSGAPDLSLAVGHLGRGGVRRVILGGRGVMPPGLVNAQEAESVIALLAWVGEHRERLSPAAPVALVDVPWFAYPASRGVLPSPAAAPAAP